MLRVLGFVVVVFAAASCTSSHDQVKQKNDLDPSPGSGGVLNGGEPQARNASVRVVLSDARVCPGQCTEVRAVVDGPGSYRYSWTPALPSGAGPHTFCPSETTHLAVKAVPDGEISSETVEATATVQVTEECSDAAAPAVGGAGAGGTQNGSAGSSTAGGGAAHGPADAGPSIPDGSPRPDWPLVEPACVTHLVGRMQLSDLAGGDDLFVSGMFSGTLTVGTTTLNSTASVYDGLVARIDSACKVVWARSLPGASRTIPYQIATGPDGNLIVAGSFDGFLDFGAGILFDTPFRNLFVAKLDRNDGHVLWNRQYSTTEIPGSNQGFTSLDVAANGDIAFTGVGNRATDFGGGPLQTGAVADPRDPAVQVTYVGKLDANGGHRYSRVLPFSFASSALHADGALSVAGLAYGVIDWGTRQVGVSGVSTEVIAELDVNGAAKGISGRPALSSAWAAPDASDALALAPDGTLFRAEGRVASADTWGYAIAMFSPGAADPVIGEITVEYPTTSQAIVSYRLSVDGAGKPFAAASFGDQPVAGRALATAGGSDAIVFRFDRAGNVDWAGHYGTGGDDTDVRVRATPSRGVFISGTEGTRGAFVARFDTGP